MNGWYRRTLVAALLSAPVVLATLAGCTSDGDSDPKPGTARSAEPAPVIDISIAPGTGKNFVGARTDVTGLTCTQQGGRWKVSGSVTNSGRVTSHYRIYTSFMTADNDTRGLLQTNVRGVAPKATKKWSDQLKVNADDLRCVLRVERIPAAPTG